VEDILGLTWGPALLHHRKGRYPSRLLDIRFEVGAPACMSWHDIEAIHCAALCWGSGPVVHCMCYGSEMVGIKSGQHKVAGSTNRQCWVCGSNRAGLCM
jgi:hypothetical protein